MKIIHFLRFCGVQYNNIFDMKRKLDIFSFFMYVIQNCRPSDSTVPEDAWIDPPLLWLWHRQPDALTTRLDPIMMWNCGRVRQKVMRVFFFIHFPWVAPIMEICPKYFISPQRNTGGVASLQKLHIWQTITKIGLPKKFRYSNSRVEPLLFSIFEKKRNFVFAKKSFLRKSSKMGKQLTFSKTYVFKMATKTF